jgi:fructokinase
MLRVSLTQVRKINAKGVKYLSKVLCIGELLIDFVPTESGLQLKDVGQFKKAAGGAPANVSATVAKLGGTAAMIGKIGADPFGDFLTETLIENGVSAKYLIKTEEAKTALAFVSLQKNGERDFMFYREPSADMLLKKSEIKAEWFEEAFIYHFGSISLIDNPVREATIEGIKLAIDHNVLISFDPNIRLPLWKSEEEARQQILTWIPKTNILKISEDELFFLTRNSNEREAVLSLFIGSVKLIVITKGANGCTYYTSNGSRDVKGVKVTPVDTTGAGDAFVGGLLYQLSEQMEQTEHFEKILTDEDKLTDILKFANVCGALTTTKRGAIPALPNRSEVLSII